MARSFLSSLDALNLFPPSPSAFSTFNLGPLLSARRRGPPPRQQDLAFPLGPPDPDDRQPFPRRPVLSLRCRHRRRGRSEAQDDPLADPGAADDEADDASRLVPSAASSSHGHLDPVAARVRQPSRGAGLLHGHRQPGQQHRGELLRFLDDEEHDLGRLLRSQPCQQDCPRADAAPHGPAPEQQQQLRVFRRGVLERRGILYERVGEVRWRFEVGFFFLLPPTFRLARARGARSREKERTRHPTRWRWRARSREKERD